MDPTRQQQQDDLELRSKLLYGNKYRLAIGNFIGQNKLVTARHVAKELRLADSVVRPELLRLTDAQVLTALPSTGRERYYERVDDPFWEYCVQEVAKFQGGAAKE